MPDDAAKQLRALVEPLAFGERVKDVISKAARRAGLSYTRAFDIWYGKARRVEAYERDQIAEALDKKNQEAARNEFHELRTRLARLEARLAQTDAEFHREDIERLRSQGAGLGGARRPVTAPA